MGEFVWFDLRTADAEGAERFYEELLGWTIAKEDGAPPMVAGAEGPWALIGGAMLPGGAQWLPYVRVEDVDDALARAQELGGTVLHERTEGPAGSVIAIADPTGAPVALWQPANAQTLQVRALMSRQARAPLAEVLELATLVSRLPRAAVLAMQDSPHRYVGREAISRFLASPAGGALDRIAVIATRANCEQALAVYRYDAHTRLFRAHGIFVLIASGRPADVFGAADAALFPYFGLPATILQMPYSEELADRVRDALRGRSGVEERKMFGGLAFLLGGRMFSGVLGDRLVVRVGAEAGARALEQPHTMPMDFTGRPLKGYVYVEPAGLETAADVQRWLAEALEFVQTLPPK